MQELRCLFASVVRYGLAECLRKGLAERTNLMTTLDKINLRYGR